MSGSLLNEGGGVWRLTYRRLRVPSHWFVLLGLTALLGVLAGVNRHHHVQASYFRWIADFYISLIVPVFAFVSGAGAIRDDLKPGAADYLFTRPIRRSVFLAFKYLSHMVCTQVDFLIPLTVLAVLGRDFQGMTSALPLLWAAQALTIAAFTAFGFFCGILTSRYVILGLVYAVAVEAAIGNIPTQLNRVSITHQVRMMLVPLTERARDALLVQSPWATSLHLLIFAGALLLAAAALFKVQEHGN